jgi:hypothetical protein
MANFLVATGRETVFHAEAHSKSFDMVPPAAVIPPPPGPSPPKNQRAGCVLAQEYVHLKPLQDFRHT